MKHFRAVIECGHFGAGKSSELIVYLQSKDILSAIEMIRKSPGLKHKGTLRGIKRLEAVSIKKYYCRLSSSLASSGPGPKPANRRAGHRKTLKYFRTEPQCGCCYDARECEIRNSGLDTAV